MASELSAARPTSLVQCTHDLTLTLRGRLSFLYSIPAKCGTMSVQCTSRIVPFFSSSLCQATAPAHDALCLLQRRKYTERSTDLGLVDSARSLYSPVREGRHLVECRVLSRVRKRERETFVLAPRVTSEIVDVDHCSQRYNTVHCRASLAKTCAQLHVHLTPNLASGLCEL